MAGKIWVGTGYRLPSQPVGWDGILNSLLAIPRVGMGYLWDIPFAKPWLGYPLGWYICGTSQDVGYMWDICGISVMEQDHAPCLGLGLA